MNLTLVIDWWLLWILIILPANKNKRDLNNACTTIWNKHNIGLISNAKNIYEIWLIVEYAIIDLMSLTKIALINDHSNVIRTKELNKIVNNRFVVNMK